MLKRLLSKMMPAFLSIVLAMLILSLFYLSTPSRRPSTTMYSNAFSDMFVMERENKASESNLVHSDVEQRNGVVDEDEQTMATTFGPFKENRTIFIVETKADLSKFRLSLLCAVTSAADSNPSWTIALISVSKTAVINKPSLLDEYQNVVVQWIDLDTFFASTPLADMWKSGIVEKSKYFLSHLSDLLRFALVYKYGGAYFDQDVISMHSVPEDPANFVIPDQIHCVAAAVFKATKGHPFLLSILNTMAKEYNPKVFAANGPKLTTRATFAYCSLPESGPTQKVLLLKCPQDFRVMSISSAYPVAGSNFMAYYSNGKSDSLEKLLHNNNTFVVHYYATQRVFWKRMGRIEDLVIQLDQPLTKLMKERCPSVYDTELLANVGTSWLSPLV